MRRVRGIAVVVAFALLLVAVPLPVRATAGTVRLMAVGDVVIAQTIGRRIIKNGADAPWRNLSAVLAQADLLVGNLECPISSRGTSWPGKKYTLRARPPAAAALVTGGFDVVNLANNHTLDYGFTAFADTLAELDARGVAHMGGGLDEAAAKAPVVLERNGLRIGFLAYALYFAPGTRKLWAAGPSKPGIVAGTPDAVSHAVSALKDQVDVVVVTFHGGQTNSAGPDSQVREFTRAATAAGAALVLGHHPHVLQGYSRVGTTFVAYSLGNFVFDYFSGVQNDSAILDVTLSANGVDSFAWIPVEIEHGFPRPARGAEVDRITARLRLIQP